MIRVISILSMLSIAFATLNAFGADWLTVSGSVAPFGRPQNLYPKYLSIRINPEEISSIHRAKVEKMGILVLKNNSGKNILAVMCDSSEAGKKTLENIEEQASKKAAVSVELDKSCHMLDDMIQNTLRFMLP